MTSVFLYQKSAFMNQPVLFISPDTCFCILHELLPAQDFRLLPMQCVSHFSFSLQDDSPVNIYVQIHSFQSVLVLQKKHKHLAQGKCTASLARGIPVHRTPESEWDIAYHTHDPIITEELFNQVQEINRSRADAYNANYGACSHLPKGDNPYRERLVCADCGTQMKLYRNLSKNHKKAYFTYICPTYEEHQELRCTKKTIRSNALDAMVLKTLKIQMELFCDAQQVLERLSKKQPKFPAHTEENELQQLEQQVKRKQGYATSLYADYRTGLLTREEYTFARGKYQEEVAALQGRISQLQERLTLTSQVSDCAKSWMALIEQYKSAEIVSRELVTAFISEIRLSADGSIKVSFLFQDELSRIRAHCKAVESEVA